MLYYLYRSSISPFEHSDQHQDRHPAMMRLLMKPPLVGTVGVLETCVFTTTEQSSRCVKDKCGNKKSSLKFGQIGGLPGPSDLPWLPGVSSRLITTIITLQAHNDVRATRLHSLANTTQTSYYSVHLRPPKQPIHQYVAQYARPPSVSVTCCAGAVYLETYLKSLYQKQLIV